MPPADICEGCLGRPEISSTDLRKCAHESFVHTSFSKPCKMNLSAGLTLVRTASAKHPHRSATPPPFVLNALERPFGIEGTGSYGAGLARYLRSEGRVVIEVIRPNRQARRRHGKSDPADADAAASTVLAGDATGQPKAADATVEMIRALRVARQTAIKARVQAGNAMQALGGDVQKNPRGREIGTVRLERIADDPLFEGLPPSF